VEIFISYLEETEIASYNETALNERLREFELGWQNGTSMQGGPEAPGSLESILNELVGT
jgi:hypothetical protein